MVLLFLVATCRTILFLPVSSSHSPDFLTYQYIYVASLMCLSRCTVPAQSCIAGSSYNLVSKEVSQGAERKKQSNKSHYAREEEE